MARHSLAPSHLSMMERLSAIDRTMGLSRSVKTCTTCSPTPSHLSLRENVHHHRHSLGLCLSLCLCLSVKMCTTWNNNWTVSSY